MGSQEFFKLFEGQWISQRTLHHIATAKTDVSKADLWIETLDSQSSLVTEACAKANLDPLQVICSLEITWKGTLSDGKAQFGSTIMVAIADPNTPDQGHLISQPSTGKTQLGRYCLESDEVMIFTTQSDQGISSERIWYASENLRIRSNTLQNPGADSNDANFCSEIRRLGTMLPKPNAAEAQQTPLAAWKARHNNQLLQNNN